MSSYIEKCIIWGCGTGGKWAYEILRRVDTIKVVGFCDSNRKLFGQKIKGVSILNFEDISPNDFDYIVVAVPSATQEVYDQLIEITDKPVLKNIYELLDRKSVDRRFTIDISGWCNARCKWCATGRKNLTNKLEQQDMKVETFIKVYNHMCSIGLLHPYNEIMLYNWGEPFLNPDFEKIISFLSEKEQVFSLSTNVSVPKYLKGDGQYYKNCKTVIFSMPGFSQNSYDRIHGFKFDVIKNNIRLLLSNLKENGFEGKARISYHVYQFNREELETAREFAKELEIEIEPTPAILASYELTKAFMQNNLSKDVEADVKRELLIQVPERLSQPPENYRCLAENMISIHWDGKLELCCCCDDTAKDFLWKYIWEIGSLTEFQAYRSKMLKSETCVECRRLGMGFWPYQQSRV